MEILDLEVIFIYSNSPNEQLILVNILQSNLNFGIYSDALELSQSSVTTFTCRHFIIKHGKHELLSCRVKDNAIFFKYLGDYKSYLTVQGELFEVDNNFSSQSSFVFQLSDS